MSIIQCCVPTETSNTGQAGFLWALVREGLPGGGIVIVMGYLNVKVISNNTLFKHVTGEAQSRRVALVNSDWFVDLCSFHRLGFGRTLFEHCISH